MFPVISSSEPAKRQVWRHRRAPAWPVDFEGTGYSRRILVPEDVMGGLGIAVCRDRARVCAR